MSRSAVGDAAAAPPAPLDALPMPGFYGKVPALGDFVRRDLPGDFVEAWDRWLGAAIYRSQQALGGRWLDYYLTCPLWRFAMSAGACGRLPVVGVLTPSVDAVNRHFPLVIAALLSDSCNPMAVCAASDDWFTEVESLALGALDPRGDLAVLHTSLHELGPPPAFGSRCRLREGAFVDQADRASWPLELGNDASVCGADLIVGMLDALSTRAFAPWSLWWTTGSNHVAPSVRLHRGLPAIDAFEAMLHDQEMPTSPDPSDCGRHRS